MNIKLTTFNKELKNLFEIQHVVKEKAYVITLRILPSIHLAGSLQISDTKYWYNVNRGKICSKIVGHGAINIIQGTIMEIHIAITYHKYIDNIRLLL